MLVALGGCGGDTRDTGGANDEPGTGAVVWNTIVDLLGGEPDAEALAPRASFRGGGIAFEHPRLLRTTNEKDEDGTRTWSFEHGLFELELYAPTHELGAREYLESLGSVFDGMRSIHVEAVDDGRVATLCGREQRAARLRMRMLGDWSEYQAFDLPAPAGESRLLVFDDEPGGDDPSAVARATWEQVIESLQCDPDFAWPEPVAPDARDDADETADPGEEDAAADSAPATDEAATRN